MVKAIKKLFKFVVYTFIALVVLVIGVGMLLNDGTTTANKTVETVKETPKIVEKPKVVKVKVKAPPTLDDKIRTMQGSVHQACKSAFKTTANYPTKVDFNWSIDSNYWKNFEGNNHRYLIKNSGEMMNGYGNMVPFTMTCKVDWNSVTNKQTLIELYVNNTILYAL